MITFFNCPRDCQTEQKVLHSAGHQKAELGAMSDFLGQRRKRGYQYKLTFAPIGNHLKLQAFWSLNLPG